MVVPPTPPSPPPPLHCSGGYIPSNQDKWQMWFTYLCRAWMNLCLRSSQPASQPSFAIECRGEDTVRSSWIEMSVRRSIVLQSIVYRVCWMKKHNNFYRLLIALSNGRFLRFILLCPPCRQYNLYGIIFMALILHMHHHDHRQSFSPALASHLRDLLRSCVGYGDRFGELKQHYYYGRIEGLQHMWQLCAVSMSMVSKTVTRIICPKKEFNKLGEEPETLWSYSGSILFSLPFRKIFNIFYDI